jgi:hypothetical protein
MTAGPRRRACVRVRSKPLSTLRFSRNRTLWICCGQLERLSIPLQLPPSPRRVFEPASGEQIRAGLGELHIGSGFVFPQPAQLNGLGAENRRGSVLWSAARISRFPGIAAVKSERLIHPQKWDCQRYNRASPQRRARSRQAPPPRSEPIARIQDACTSKIILNGVSVARRKRLKPASVATWRNLPSPACAPSPNATS